MISIWLCPTHEDELYFQKIINKLSENYNSPIFLPHCTLLGGIKLNEFDLENIIDISIDNIGLIKIKSNGIDYTNIIWKTVFIKLVLDKKLKTLQEKFYKQIEPNIDYKFDPHISLMYKILPDNTKKEIINSLDLKNSFKMNKIAIVNTGQNVSEWEIILEKKINA